MISKSRSFWALALTFLLAAGGGSALESGMARVGNDRAPWIL